MDGRALVAWNLRRIRVKRGLSQERLAFDAGLALSYVGGLERREKNPTVERSRPPLQDACGPRFGILCGAGQGFLATRAIEKRPATIAPIAKARQIKPLTVTSDRMVFTLKSKLQSHAPPIELLSPSSAPKRRSRPRSRARCRPFRLLRGERRRGSPQSGDRIRGSRAAPAFRPSA